ncbi:S-adenosyl-L-methionine-dependent methyltransferase [Aulographum hederae CBS 113979]|uniref:S-adenosyl-L-methionine-dependent methyltransferase n=1 Tax=Aulographum hederae CBS 113979 TaxID=1176131 RepID=A0A6G1H2A9_9PEZI|nr:S-adenosyl-L-methionine-dependent methyltransferase [Aulographum hederae CBS 113979]
MYSTTGTNPNAGLFDSLKMEPETRFDDEAASWDLNPFTRKSSQLALGTILEKFPEKVGGVRDGIVKKEDGLTVLELGCGTGLLSLLVAPYVKSLTAVDTSEGMIAALKAKFSQSANTHTNIRPICLNLDNPDDPAIQDDASKSPKRFDLCISHLVLHHIPDLSRILRVLYGTLAPGGHICLTDFENFGLDARKFHPEAKMHSVERHGIGKIEMEGLMVDAGFVDVSVRLAFTMEKDVEPEGVMKFPFLVCMGRKSKSVS